ncbi:hypothetical protein B14911_23507 [Bacillus sp. NRRL B-14911]|nr:hypothetical protein B14911_23507 [Bacillus sp. NRRL B-14911]
MSIITWRSPAYNEAAKHLSPSALLKNDRTGKRRYNINNKYIASEVFHVFY